MAEPEVRITKKFPARGAILAALLGVWGSVLTSPASSASHPNRDLRFEFRLSTPDIELERRPDGFAEIQLEGFGTHGRRPGAPSLPLKSYLVAIPPGVVPRLEVRLTAPASYLPGVIPRPVPRSDTTLSAAQSTALIKADPSPAHRTQVLTEATRLVYEVDPAVYEGDAVFPAEVARLGRTGVLRDQRYVEVLVSPVRYDPAVQGLRLHQEVEVVVHFDGYEAAPAAARDERFFEAIYRETLVNYVQGREFRLSAYAPRPAPQGRSGPAVGDPAKGSSSRRRIVTREDGMVRLDYDRLQSAPGLLATHVSNWRLTRMGETLPLQIHDDGDGLIEPGEWVRFYGQAFDHEPKTELNMDFPEPFKDLYEARDFTDETTYFLAVEDQAQPEPAAVDATPVGRTPPDFFVETVRTEVDDAYRPLGGEDPWYWLPTLVTTGENPPTRVQPVAVPGLFDATLPLEATVEVRGTSSTDHLTRLRLRNEDGLVLASQDGAFDGLTLFTHELSWNWGGSGPVATDALTLELEVLPTGHGRNDVIPNFFELSYRRAFEALDDSLQFGWPDEDAEFIVENLSTSAVDVFELTSTPDGGGIALRRLTGATVSGVGPYNVRFRIDDDPALEAGTMREFLVISEGAGSVPADTDFVPDQVSNLRDTLTQADMIVVAHPDLLDDAPGSVLNQLLDYKASAAGGEITSVIARLNDVYDEFNGGQPGPLAIREFLRWVMSTEPGEGWADPKPTYVMLLGDGSYDYKGGTATGNFVPTQVLFKDDPQLGYYASDNLMVAVVGDDQSPDLVIGRLPGRSVEQINMVLQKTLDYSATPDLEGPWRRHALLISDRGSSQGEGNLDFESTNSRVQSLICSSGTSTVPGACPGSTAYTSKHLRYYSDYYTNPAILNPRGRMSTDLKAAVNGEDGVSDGAVLLQYSGHGNFLVWSGDAFFDQRPPAPPGVIDTEELFNSQRLPWLMAHNCLTGGFHITQPSTMGEDWVHRVGGGSIGLFSPTGLSYNYVGETVSDLVWKALYGRYKVRDIAVPVMSALTSLCAQGSIEPCQHYALLGDPSLRLNLHSVEPATDLDAVGEHQQVNLSWTPSSTPGAAYDIYRKRGSFQYQKINATPWAQTHFTDTGLTNATVYSYYVVAVDPEGFESRWSNFNEDCSPGSADCVKATPLNPDPPGAPTGLTVSDPGLGNLLVFNWDPNPESDLAYYTIHYGYEPGSYTTVQVIGKQTQAGIPNLIEGQPVYFAVSASNTSERTSPLSAEVSDFPVFAPGLRPPGYIQDLRVERAGSDLLLEWGEIAADSYGKPMLLATYEVFRGTGYRNEALVKIGECAAPCSSFTDPGAADLPDALQYRVRALDTTGLAGGLGAQFPRGTVLTVDVSPAVPGNLTLSWLPVESTISGGSVSGIVYRVVASGSVFTLEAARSGAVEVLLTTAGTSVDVTPAAESRYYSVLAVDEKGNVSPY